MIVKNKSLVIVQIVTLLPRKKKTYKMCLNESYSTVRVGKHFSDIYRYLAAKQIKHMMTTNRQNTLLKYKMISLTCFLLKTV